MLVVWRRILSKYHRTTSVNLLRDVVGLEGLYGDLHRRSLCDPRIGVDSDFFGLHVGKVHPDFALEEGLERSMEKVVGSYSISMLAALTAVWTVCCR